MHSNRGATTSSKLGVQFLGLGCYYPSTEKELDRSTQFGAVGYIITLYSSKSYVKSWGSVQILGRSGPLRPPVVAPMINNLQRVKKVDVGGMCLCVG